MNTAIKSETTENDLRSIDKFSGNRASCADFYQVRSKRKNTFQICLIQLILAMDWAGTTSRLIMPVVYSVVRADTMEWVAEVTKQYQQQGRL